MGFIQIIEYETVTRVPSAPPWIRGVTNLRGSVLPVIDLGQVGFWQLRGGWQWLATAMILLGWILATTVAAGATRLLRRN